MLSVRPLKSVLRQKNAVFSVIFSADINDSPVAGVAYAENDLHGKACARTQQALSSVSR